MITLINGNVQNPSALAVPNGSVSFQLNIDATIIAAPFGIIPGSLEVVFQFDENGDILPNAPAVAAQIYSNLELNPQNEEGLGTYYLVTFYDANGARINASPMWWQFIQAANTTVDIGEVTPFATVGGNVIFYPISLAVPPPSPSTLGGVFSNVGAPHQFVISINTNGSITLAQPSFADISGTLSNAQLPSPITFGTTSFSGLITAQANIQLGVVGTTGGQITMEGLTSGAATITAPSVAGTPANPILFSNGINIPLGTALSISSDSGISRLSAGVIAVGNGTPADVSGALSLAGITASGIIKASILQGGPQDSVQTASGASDALIFPGSTFITTAGVDATTLATPVVTTDDGKKITVVDAGGHAHTITTASNKIVPAHSVVTFNGTVGSWIELEAYQGLWYPKASSGVAIA